MLPSPSIRRSMMAKIRATDKISAITPYAAVKPKTQSVVASEKSTAVTIALPIAVPIRSATCLTAPAVPPTAGGMCCWLRV